MIEIENFDRNEVLIGMTANMAGIAELPESESRNTALRSLATHVHYLTIQTDENGCVLNCDPLAGGARSALAVVGWDGEAAQPVMGLIDKLVTELNASGLPKQNMAGIFRVMADCWEIAGN